MGFIKAIRDEWPVLRGAPWSVAIIVGTCLAAGGGGASLVLNTEIATLKERAETAQQRADDWKERDEADKKASASSIPAIAEGPLAANPSPSKPKAVPKTRRDADIRIAAAQTQPAIAPADAPPPSNPSDVGIDGNAIVSGNLVAGSRLHVANGSAVMDNEIISDTPANTAYAAAFEEERTTTFQLWSLYQQTHKGEPYNASATVDFINSKLEAQKARWRVHADERGNVKPNSTVLPP